MTPKQIREVARQEIAEEAFRRAVDAEKQRQRERKPWWHKLVPFRITITRR